MTGRRTRIILWRHGQTDYNLENRFQGQADVPLNETGLAQAHEAAGILARMSVDALVTSPLSRAVATVETLASSLDLPVNLDERLMEISVGSWEGMLADEVYRLHPDFSEALRDGRDARRSPQGETAVEVGLRVGAAIRDIAASHPAETVVLGCHGLAIRMGVANVLGWDYPVSTTLASMHNCAWTVLVARATGDWKLVSWNQVAASPLT